MTTISLELEQRAYLAAWGELVLAADLAAHGPLWVGAAEFTLEQVRALAAAPLDPAAPIAPARLALAAAQVAAVRHIAAELMPALTAVQRLAERRALAGASDGSSRAAALAAALDASAQIIRNTLSLLKELPLGSSDAAAVAKLLWGLALHAQIRCARAHEALPADGHALAALAGALQLLESTLLRHGLAAAAERAGVTLTLGQGALTSYRQTDPVDGIELGLAVLRDGQQAVRWLQAAVAEESYALTE